MLDAGCGEGSYLRRLHAILKQTLPALQTDLCGLDISKHAIKAAAKADRDHAMTWLVASNRQLPFTDQSLDIILCAFGFPVWPEFRRVLKPDGIVILADPGPDHLIELRHLLYENVTVKEIDFQVPGGFAPTETQIVNYTFPIVSSNHLRDLIAMTPHQHRVPQVKIDYIVGNPPAALTLDIRLRMLSPA